MGRPKLYDNALRQRLIDQTAKDVNSKGWQHLALRRITESCDTSTNAIYTLFGSLGSLLSEVVQQQTEAIAIDWKKNKDNPPKKIAGMTRKLVNWAVENPNLYDLTFQSIKTQQETLGLNPDTFLAGKMEPVFARISPDNAAELTQIYWTALRGQLDVYLQTQAVDKTPEAKQNIAGTMSTLFALITTDQHL